MTWSIRPGWYPTPEGGDDAWYEIVLDGLHFGLVSCDDPEKLAEALGANLMKRIKPGTGLSAKQKKQRRKT